MVTRFTLGKMIFIPVYRSQLGIEQINSNTQCERYHGTSWYTPVPFR
jgi:hypothetical protein